MKNSVSLFLTCVAASQFLTLWRCLYPSDNVGCYELESKAWTCFPKEEVECVAHSHGSFHWSNLPYKKAI